MFKWTKDTTKARSSCIMEVQRFLIFPSCCRGTGKSHLIKTIYKAVDKTLIIIQVPRALLLGTTGLSAVNIDRTTIHS